MTSWVISKHLSTIDSTISSKIAIKNYSENSSPISLYTSVKSYFFFEKKCLDFIRRFTTFFPEFLEIFFWKFLQIFIQEIYGDWLRKPFIDSCIIFSMRFKEMLRNILQKSLRKIISQVDQEIPLGISVQVNVWFSTKTYPGFL